MAGRVRCPECDELWPEGAKFCGRCGSPLGIGATSLSPQARRGSRSRRTRLVITVLAIAAAVWLIGGVLAGEDPQPVGPPMPDDGGPIQSSPADPFASVRWGELSGLSLTA